MRTITGLYDSYDDARDAVKALEDAGVPSEHISIISNKDGREDIEGQGKTLPEAQALALVLALSLVAL